MPPANASAKWGYVVLSQSSCVDDIQGALPEDGRKCETYPFAPVVLRWLLQTSGPNCDIWRYLSLVALIIIKSHFLEARSIV